VTESACVLLYMLGSVSAKMATSPLDFDDAFRRYQEGAACYQQLQNSETCKACKELKEQAQKYLKDLEEVPGLQSRSQPNSWFQSEQVALGTQPSSSFQVEPPELRVLPSLVFVLGAPRSGSTMLETMIGVLPDVHALGKHHRSILPETKNTTAVFCTDLQHKFCRREYRSCNDASEAVLQWHYTASQ
jgi:hypothetical protein